MNFQALIQSDCGQSNPISQLVRHVTDDRGFQESIGNPYTFGLNQNNVMHPQSFRMNDLMREIGQIEPQRMPIPSPSSSHIDVENHSSLGNAWTTDYQNQTQEYPQTKIEQIWNENNLHNYGSETNHFSPTGFIDAMSSPLYGLPESQNFINNNEQWFISQFGAKSQEPENSLADLADGITINSLDELKILEQLEENCKNPQKMQDEQLPELLPETENCKYERKSIPEYSNPKDFINILSKCLDEFRKNELKVNYQQRVTLNSLLNPMPYSHIENNPMRDELQLVEKGREALVNACYSKAPLYYDEAVRRNEGTPKIWFDLSYALYLNDQDDKAISAIKHYLRLRPKCFRGISVLWNIYNKYGCKYQACQTVLYWLQNNELYNHLIPPDFIMEDKHNCKELDENVLDSVKNLLLKAVRENPSNIDGNLQIMIGNLYSISKDYDKVTDCKRTAINVSNGSCSCDLYNMGFSLFYDGKPYEALDTFFETVAFDHLKINSYEAIGILYTYLQNFRKAIHYFKKALGPEILSQESKFQLKGNTLEDEYELCLRLFCENRCK